MSKKSYMDRKALLEENFFTKLKKILLGKQLAVKRKGLKDKAADKAWAEVRTQLEKSEKQLRKSAKNLGLDYDTLLRDL